MGLSCVAVFTAIYIFSFAVAKKKKSLADIDLDVSVSILGVFIIGSCNVHSIRSANFLFDAPAYMYSILYE